MRVIPARDRLRRVQQSLAYRLAPKPASADGLPLPPPTLIYQVAGTPRVEWYQEGGALAAGSIREAMERNGARLEELGAILDFGCGCGRVIRHWKDLPARVHGCDIDPRLVRWCRRHLPFASFAVNGARPPLPYGDAAFDLVYVLSVFTHLPEPAQRPWIDELRRVTRPGGHVLLTVHGEHYRYRLDEEEKRRFDAGELVVQGADSPGLTQCGAFHPPAYVRHVLADGFELVEHVAEGAAGNPSQDIVLLRRR